MNNRMAELNNSTVKIPHNWTETKLTNLERQLGGQLTQQHPYLTRQTELNKRLCPKNPLNPLTP
jgi:hypothetical protein